MPNMYSRIIIHATFSTRYRKKLLRPEIESDIYGYLGGTLNGLGCTNIITNGYRDHVHLLFHCPARLAVSDVIRDLKKSSGAWVRERYAMPYFHWQGGGGAFSVDHREIDSTIAYIETQRAHHEQTGEGFEAEYPRLLRTHQIEFDERYLLDPLKEEV